MNAVPRTFNANRHLGSTVHSDIDFILNVHMSGDARFK